MTNLNNLNELSGIYIFGTPGSGKTHLIKAIYNSLNDIRGITGRFISTCELLFEIRNTFGDSAEETELEVIEKYTNEVDILFLDDFGAEKISEFTAETFYVILNRFELKPYKKLIISSNYSLNQIADKVSDRIASRISGLCEILKLNDIDHRAEKQTSPYQSFETFRINKNNKAIFQKCYEFVATITAIGDNIRKREEEVKAQRIKEEKFWESGEGKKLKEENIKYMHELFEQTKKNLKPMIPKLSPEQFIQERERQLKELEKIIKNEEKNKQG